MGEIKKQKRGTRSPEAGEVLGCDGNEERMMWTKAVVDS